MIQDWEIDLLKLWLIDSRAANLYVSTMPYGSHEDLVDNQLHFSKQTSGLAGYQYPKETQSHGFKILSLPLALGDLFILLIRASVSSSGKWQWEDFIRLHPVLNERTFVKNEHEIYTMTVATFWFCDPGLKIKPHSSSVSTSIGWES